MQRAGVKLEDVREPGSVSSSVAPNFVIRSVSLVVIIVPTTLGVIRSLLYHKNGCVFARTHLGIGGLRYWDGDDFDDDDDDDDDDDGASPEC